MSKFSVIQTGGKQYKVKSGDRLKIEKIIGDFKIGDKIDFENVLLIADGDNVKVGAPYITGEKVSAEIIDIAKHKTVEVVKYMPKSRYFKRNGHRQPYFEVKIA